MATNVSFIPPQFFTDAGAVAALHLLDVFTSGTLNRETTWTDAAEGGTNANPIVLDAAGRCTLFVDPTVLYTFRLRTPGGATLWTRDSIAGLPESSAEQFLPLDPNDAEMISRYTLAGDAQSALQPTTLQQVNALIAAAVATAVATFNDQVLPVGAVIDWPIGSSPGSKYLLLTTLNPTASRTTYAALFALWGTTFGVGDGTTTFGLQPRGGKFMRGLDGGAGVDTGRAVAQAQATAVGPHTHFVVKSGVLGVSSGSTLTNANYLIEAALTGGNRSDYYLQGQATAADEGLTSVNTGTESRPINEPTNYWVRALP